MKFSQLEKNCGKPTDGFSDQCTLALLGNCATQHMAVAIKGYAYEEGIAMQVFDADYNQIDAQTMDDNSELYAFSPDFTLFYISSEKLYEDFCATPDQDRKNFAEAKIAQILGYWKLVRKHYRTHILQLSFIEADDRVFGNFGSKTQDSFIYQIRKLNLLLMEQSQICNDVFVIDLAYLRSAMGDREFRDEKLYYIAKMPISVHALPEVARQVVTVIKSIRGKIKKCVIVDLDNTLWGGVIGDDGLENIQIGELGLGHAFSEFQMWLRELRKRGIILAVCSKNEESTAKEPFLKHPEMILRLEDISMFVANWEDKASNIKMIQSTLNIGMDSIIFLDDNPFERNLVKGMIPDITVPDLPEDPSLYLRHLKSMNLFETASYSDADKARTRQYQEEIGREELQKQFTSFEAYLESLEMKAEVKPFDKFHFSRIAQLTQRSNQFNLRTIRYTEEEIRRIAEDDAHITMYFTLRDRFGDYGLISVVILDKLDDKKLFISEWLMSCRVLKRGMEEFIVDNIMRIAGEQGYMTVKSEYIRTPKNNMVSDIYKRMGFEETGDGLYEGHVERYIPHKTYIVRGPN